MTKIPITADELERFCVRHGIRSLALFGSRTAGTARDSSDIDLLVEFAANRKPGLLQMAAMESELSSLLGHRKVDLRTYEDLSRHFREQVRRDAEVQYPRP